MSSHITHNAHKATKLKFDTDSKKRTPPEGLPQRSAEFNKLGKDAMVTLNTFNVISTPKRQVFQYDVSHQCFMH